MIGRALLAFFILTIARVRATSFAITPGSLTINAVTNYVWSFTFSPAASRPVFTLTVPSYVAFSPSSNVLYNGVAQSVTSVSNNSITFSGANFSNQANLTLTITLITNPPSAVLSASAFTITTSQETALQLPDYNSISYTKAQLATCGWAFSLCTQQPSSQLSIAIKTQNGMLAGNNALRIGYGAVWANHNSKNLMFQVSAFTCTVSLNNITNLTTTSCVNTPASNLITLNFIAPADIPANSTLYATVSGVQTPPTATTPSSSSYYVATADASGYLIDQLSCTISPVCITNVTGGQFTTPGLTVNQVLLFQQINFMSYPIITVLASDVVEIIYAPASNLVGCSVLKFWRALGDLKILTTSVPLVFVFPSGMIEITDTSYPIYLYLACSAIVMPSSQASTQMVFNFYRASSQYLQLTASVSVTAAAFNLALASLVLSSTEMAHTSTDYIFSFVTGHQLGTTPGYRFGFPIDANISAATCSLSVSGAPIASSCSVSGSGILLNFTSATVVSSNSSFIVTVSGVTNPSLPQLYNFSLSSYYNSSDTTTIVQTASPAFNATFTTITSLLPALTPSAFTVYANTQTNLTITIPISIPISSTFFIEFPSAVMQLTCTSQPLLANNSASLAANTSLNSSNNSVILNNAQAIPANSTLIFMFTLRAPALIGTYSYVTLIISNTVTYIQSTNSLSMSVSVPSSMPVSLVANNPLASQTSSYNLSVTYTVPHPGLFDLVIDLPSDTAYLSATAGSCVSNCVISSFNANGSQITLAITNLFPNSTSIFTATYMIATFSNRRYVATGPVFNITTSVGPNVITKESTTVQISGPALMIGQLNPNVFYFRNNSALVDVYLNLTASLIAGDYLLLTIDRTTYTGSSILCSPFFGSCTVNPISTTNVLVITIIPNISSYSTNPLQITIEGLTSGLNTNYFQTDYITVGHYCAGGLIEAGKIPYNISCGSAIAFPNQCKTCYSNGSCIDCYSSSGYYLFNSVCVTSCGSATQFLRYPNSTTSACQPCSGNCLTCVNASACLTCLNSSYFLYTDSLTCQLTCGIYQGYTVSSIGSQPTCLPCADSFCLHCNTTDYGTCTLCNNISTLNSGICSSSCANVSFYISSSQCVVCDPSCYTCSSGGNQSCIRCASGYVNNSGTCTTSCPNGTAAIPNTGVCGCDPTCLTCASNNYITCTACIVAANFVYLGQCIASCPNGSYQSGTNCLSCPTGCDTCAPGTCLSCYTGWYRFNGQCYSDCNQVSQQYDQGAGVCVLCPSGCDTCSGSTCSSCLTSYTLSSAECKLTCSLTNSCQSQVVPLPGSIALVVWIGTVFVVVHFAAPLSFIPYSLMLVSAVIELVLTIVLIAVSGQTINARLLYSSNSNNLTTSVGLLGCSVALNYIFNGIYICIFMKYIKPLINKPKQSDIIAHTVVLVLATITNYRFGLIAFCKMCPKPRVPIDNSSRLTPVHYLCIGTAIVDVLTLISCGLQLYTQVLGGTLFMFALDLLIVVLFNIIVTIWFVASSKSDEYYKDKAKYEVEEENPTNENVTHSNEKDISKINIVAIESEHFDDDNGKERENINLGAQYRTTRGVKTKINVRSTQNESGGKGKQGSGEEQSGNELSFADRVNVKSLMEETIEQQSSKEKEVDVFAKEFADPDFEEAVPNRRPVQRFGNSKITSMQATVKQSRRYNDLRQSRNSNLVKFDKELDEQEEPKRGNGNIFEVTLEEESEIPDLDEVSQVGNLDVLNKKTETVRMRSVKSHSQSQSQHIGAEKLKRMKMEEMKKVNMSAVLPKGILNTYDVQKARQRSEQSESGQKVQLGQGQEDDFEMVVRRKVLESSLRKKQQINLFEEADEFEDVSPSRYNAANLRFRQKEGAEEGVGK